MASGHVSVASVLLRCCRDQQLREAILVQDNGGNNALHHAIRSGDRKLALELIAAEPALSKAVNKYNESPMFVAVMRNFEDVFKKMLEIPDSAHGGICGKNALHAAVRNGNSGDTCLVLYLFFSFFILETKFMQRRRRTIILLGFGPCHISEQSQNFLVNAKTGGKILIRILWPS
jgi:ankyrin repeat protein